MSNPYMLIGKPRNNLTVSEDVTDRLSRNVCKKLPPHTA